MPEIPFDTRARESGTTQGRRASLKALGAAALLALAAPSGAEGKSKSGKRAKKAAKACQAELATCRTELEARCQRQVNVCTTQLATVCNQQQDCAALLSCCQFLSTCNAESFFTCVIAASN